MKIDITSLCFGFKIEKDNDSGTAAWATSIGQAPRGICYIDTNREGLDEIVYGMMYKSHSDFENLKVRDVEGLDKREEPRGDRERMMFSVFDNVYVNNIKVDGIYILSYEREDTPSHKNRLHICYAKYLTYKGHSNKMTLMEMAKVLGCSEDACWFVSDISVRNQKNLHFTAIVVNPDHAMNYVDSKTRKIEWESLLPEQSDISIGRSTFPLQQIFYDSPTKEKFLPYLTALRTKPFMLLAGISGTGKSRIVRELAKACWKEGDEEYGKNNPKNFCMVQVKPNWHDSSELIGYVSRINGEKYVVGPFLRFLAKAINDPDTPYFLCLDEMNLAPVEQYFAEYLSVIESRKSNADGSITTDPIVPYENTEAYGTLIDQLFYDDADRKEYKSETGTKRLTIPQNLFVIGTVNMDETTFSFSRKVLDRAMTIEMNEVDLHGGLTDEGSEIGYIGNSIIGNAAEGKDVYAGNKDLCDDVLAYLEKVNTVLEGTPFKIAYRTRNEFLLYAVNRQLLYKDSQLWQTLDEMTSMKILSRIEGDSERTKKVLEELKALVDEEINKAIPEPEEGKEKLKSISAAKIKEMLEKLSSGYTSYWA